MTTAGPALDASPRSDGDRIEQLLDEVAAMAAPQLRSRVEELVQRLVGLYGEGLSALLRHARRAGADGPRLEEALVADELLSSLLLLHGLHPLPTEQRVAAALDALAPQLAAHGGGVELAGLDEGVVRVRLKGACDGCGSSQQTMESAIRAALEAAAPEIARIDLEGAKTPLPVLP